MTSVKSEIQNPFNIDDNVFYGIPVNAILQVPQGIKSKYEAYSGWISNFKKVVEAGTSWNLVISSLGNGYVAYDGNTIRSGSKSFNVDEASSIVLTITPDNGYRVKSVKVNNVDVTSSVSNNSYTISNIGKDTNVEVEFDAISLVGNNFEVDGLYYEIISSNEVEVTYKKTNGGSYSGIIKIPDNVKYNGANYKVTSIGDDAFLRCKALTSLTLPESLTSIGNSAFSECENLSGALTIPNSVKEIGSDAFFYCKALTSLTLSESLTSIGNRAFGECENLSGALTIPNSVSHIGEKAFRYCSQISSVISHIEKPFEIPEDVFQYLSSNAILQVPIGTKSKYQSYSGWTKNFKSIIEQDGTKEYILSIKATGNGSASYDGMTIRGYTTTFTVSEGTNISITFTPDNGYRIKSVKENNTIVTSYVSNNSYTIRNISKDTNVEVEFEAIPATTYTLSITASGSGSASYNGTSIRSKTSTFTVNEGTNVSITFTPDNGYRIKSVKENNTIVTSYVSNNTYKINSISRNTTVEVEFEAIPQTTYTLTIAVSGGGSVYYEGEIINNSTNYYTVNDGTYATIYFTPDDGYRLKSVKENYYDVTSQIGSNSYTTYISGNTSIEVEFEEISVSTYSLSVKASGSGSVSYNGSTVRNRTTSFTVEEGTNATITFTPDNGYRLKSVVVNNYNVTSSVSNNSYTISYINRDTNVEVEFEAIPATTYTLSVKAVGSGSASYNGTIVRDKTSTFSVSEGTNVTITFTPDNGYRIKSLVVNNADVTSYISNNTYSINSIAKNTTLVVEFEAEPTAFAVNGVNYTIRSNSEKTVAVSRGTYGAVLEIPAKVSYQNAEWKVTSIESNALSSSPDLCAIIWNPEVAFTENVRNPNLLLYVKAEDYAPTAIKNVVVNGSASSITLTDAASGNNFYCPEEFTAKSISYTHHYTMDTGLGESKGWETIALPFDVQKISHQSKGEIVPFANWKSGDSKKPFWLMEFGNSGWKDANSIKAYTPYIISMPNHEKYKADYKLNGNVTFSAANVKIGKTQNYSTSSYGGKTFVPNYSLQTDRNCLALNVNNDYITYQGSDWGGKFSSGRDVHPFEAYMTTTSGARSIAISDDMTTTGIRDIMEMLDEQKGVRVYNLKGQLIKTEDCKSLDQVKKTLPAGVYIINGQKVIIK